MPELLELATMEFRLKLKNRMDTLGHDQQTLARLVGVTDSKMSRWCRGISEPSLIEGVRLADVLGVPVAWLADDSQPWPPPVGVGIARVRMLPEHMLPGRADQQGDPVPETDPLPRRRK